jgi:1,4-alpha-glucan branching enzyme
MRIFRPLFSLLLSILLLPAAQAQVVKAQPSPFQDTDAVTLTFDATQGDGGLKDFTGDVFIYTGVVTASASSNTWNHVKSSAFNTGDPASKMTRSSTNPNLYTITLTPRTFYPGVTATEKIYKLAMLFKNADGTRSGRGTNGTDIFVNVAQDAFNLRFTNPTGTPPYFFAQGTPTNVTVATSIAATITLYLNDVQIARQVGVTTLTAPVSVTQAGTSTLRATATDGTTTATTEIALQPRPVVVTAALPAGAKPDGVTYLNGGTSVIISLTAPNKQFVYVLGDFNNWQPVDAAFMKRTTETNTASEADAASGRWWVQLDGLTPGQEYGYQFLVDGNLRVADAYADKILDPNNDRFIPDAVYAPAERQYPTGKTTGIVSVLQTNQTPYVWKATSFQRPARTNMVVYELHLRDFIGSHDFNTLMGDTLNYLQRLGINTIELMPISEFDGNDSWGYNPDFYFTPDKNYGTRVAYKQFIDECHRRGIAVVMDMVLNQSTGQSPMIQLYADGSGYAPRADNPWYNVEATHPFSVFTDFNHESPYTRYFSKRVMEYWLKEYHIDGYRFDLSKGFTQNRTTTTEAWGRYDKSRINIWKDYYNTLHAADATAYPILEHFADNEEEKELSATGFMLWHNMNHNYNEATMGYVTGSNSDLSASYYKIRGFAEPNLLTYMESHDEERLAYKNKMYGNSGPNGYNVKNLATSMARNEAAAAFFFTVPGPKMIWQFGEVGYDYSLFACQNGELPGTGRAVDDCKTGAKPIHREYYQDASRRRLYDVYRSLIALKTSQPVFANPTTYTQDVAGAVKTIHLADDNLSVTVVGNFDVSAAAVTPAFQSTGTWYNYLTGAPFTVTNVNAPLQLGPGEYAVYTSRQLTRPAGALASRSAQTPTALHLTASPNPTATTATLRYELPASASVSVTVSNMLGATVRTVTTSGRQSVGSHELTLPVSGLANGVYLVRLLADGQQQTTRLVVQH